MSGTTSLINNLGGVAGFGENVLTRGDDAPNSGAINLSALFPSGLEFFGAARSSLFVNTNGVLSFDSAITASVGSNLAGLGQAVIAPFWADVETTVAPVGGTTPGGTSTGSNLVYYDLDTVNRVFTATWDDVGRFNDDNTLRNAFQVRILGVTSDPLADANDFDIEFRYESINWALRSNGVTTAVPTMGLGAPGFPAVLLPGSNDATAALNVDTASNIGASGRFFFNIRDGVVMATTEGNDTLSGSDEADSLSGGNGDDRLHGGGGDDTLDGGGGVDTLHGGQGRDTYFVDNILDQVIEGTDAGLDRVFASASHTLASFVEDLVLTGSDNLNGTGNELLNEIRGNDGNNILNGGAGRDTMSAWLGDDTLIGGLGDDILLGGGGVDVFVFNGNFGADTIEDFATVAAGGPDRDYIDFRGAVGLGTPVISAAGADTLITTNLGSVRLMGVNSATVTSADILITPPTSLINGLGGPAGFGTNTLPPSDDTSANAAAADFLTVFADGLNFFGTTFTQLFVNNNGNVSFDFPLLRSQGFNFTNNLGLPVIAPFWADVDTTVPPTGGNLSGGTSTGSNLVYFHFDAAAHVFTATWDDVGRFPGDNSLRNAFQLRLIQANMLDDEAATTDFDIEFRYEDINGMTRVPTLGFAKGTGLATDAVLLPQSGDVAAALTMETQSNIGDAGRFLFNIRNGLAVLPTEGDNRRTGTNQNESLDGLGGNDTLLGFGGKDTLLGGMGDDTLDGGAENDTLDGGTGDDLLRGGAGADVFVFTGNFGADTIEGFATAGAGESADRIDFSGAVGLGIPVISAAGADTLITTNLGSIRLVGVDHASLTNADLRITGPTSLINGLGGAAGFGENALNRGNTTTTSAVIDLSTIFAAGLEFFGSLHTGLFVNTAGLLSFQRNVTTGEGSNLDVTLSAPVIAPFWEQVDTRVTPVGGASPGGTSTGSNLVHYDLDTVNRVFTATWDDVGRFFEDNSVRNAFQVRLYGATHDPNADANDFDIEFRYESMDWGSNSSGNGTPTLGFGAPDLGPGFDPRLPPVLLPQSGDAVLAQGVETASNIGAPGRFFFNIRDGVAMATTGGNDTLSGSDEADSLSGGFGDDSLFGGSDNDSLFGGEGRDSLYGGEGDDLLRQDGGPSGEVLDGGAGNDTGDWSFSAASWTIDLEAGTAIIFGFTFEQLTSIENVIGGEQGIGQPGDVIIGNTAENRLEGRGGNDSLFGGAGTDSLFGGEGDDLLNQGFGGPNEVLDGGAGHDTADWSYSAEAWRIDLQAGTADVGIFTFAQLTSIENAIGGQQGTTAPGDTIIGDAVANRLEGRGGHDSIDGAGGDDTLEGGTENDTLLGGLGNDRLLGGDGGDSLDGGTENDTLDGGAGDDRLDGGTGGDTASYAGTLAGVTVNLGVVGAQVTGGAGTDTLISIENLIGGNGADSLTGAAGANRVEGDAGNDVLAGGTGDDTLIGGDNNDTLRGEANNDRLSGGAGNDNMTGGAGLDRFLVEAGTDTITDLGAGGNDLLNVSAGAIANATLAGDWTALGGVSNAGVANLTSAGFDVNLSAATGVAPGLWSVSNAGQAAAVVFIGSALRDRLTGGLGQDSLVGNGGDDTLTGGDARDTLIGGAGVDSLVGGQGDDVLTGGLDVDRFRVELGTDTITDLGFGGPDALIVVAGATANATMGGHWIASAGTNNAGSVSVFANGFNVNVAVVSGASGWALSNAAHVRGVGLIGSGNADTITGGNGADTLRGQGGADAIVGGDGGDQLFGGQGDDTMTGGADVDRFAADFGVDTITDLGLGGGDVLIVSAGATANATLAADWVATAGSGNAGVANVNAAGFDVTLTAAVGPNGWNVSNAGQAAAVTLIGSARADVLTGGSGADTLIGGVGNDTLIGGGGADSLIGGQGDDRFMDSVGAQIYEGGAGRDRYSFFTGHGHDSISDFTRGQDKIEFSGFAGVGFGNLQITYGGAGTPSDPAYVVVSANGGVDSISISLAAPTILTATDFIFA
jgi:Ca2+-binding RTX toxin-like protein